MFRHCLFAAHAGRRAGSCGAVPTPPVRGAWRRRSPRAWLPAIAAAAFLLAGLAGLAGVAAHGALIGTEPRDGSVLAAPPSHVALLFNEPVKVLLVRLVGPDGAEIALGPPLPDQATVRFALPAELAAGTHALTWRIASDDGHPVGGSVSFSIAAPSAPPPAAEEPDPLPARIAIWALRATLYVGLFLGVGGAFALVWLWPAGGAGNGARRFVAAALALGFLAAPLSLGLQGLDAHAEPLASLLRRHVWEGALQTSFTRTVALALAAMLLAALSLRAGARRRRPLAAAAVVGVGLALAASGHAASAPPQFLTRPAVFLHGLGIALWTGALLPLLAGLRQGGDAGRTALFRFSRAIPYALVPLVAAGVILASVQIDGWDELWRTAYGRIFLAKLGVLTLLFGLAAWNRFRLTPALAAARPGAEPRFVRAIATEMVCVAAIFVLVAGWRFTPPPRALAAQESRTASVHIHDGRAMAAVEFSPGRPGPARVTLELLDGEFEPLPAKAVDLSLANPSAGIAPTRHTAVAEADGRWTVEQVALPVPGSWRVRIDASLGDAETITLESEVTIER